MQEGLKLHVMFTKPIILLLSLLTLSLLSLPEVSRSASFKIKNKCRHTIWPGLLSGAGTAQLPTTGFSLLPGKSRTVQIPKSWSGRIWARSHCSLDSAGKFSCLTADCGSGQVECSGTGAKPPATLAEFTLNGAGGLDFYDVSLVDGYNLPVLVIPRNGRGGACSATGCLVDLNGACPKELRLASGNGSRWVACRSACEAFGDPRYCCSGAYNTPQTCPPTVYAEYFKNACPRSYSYAYDDKTSTYTCASADYIIIFCPLPYTRSQNLVSSLVPVNTQPPKGPECTERWSSSASCEQDYDVHWQICKQIALQTYRPCCMPLPHPAETKLIQCHVA